MKLNAGPAEKGQVTLEVAFNAGQLLKEAKELKKKALASEVIDLVRELETRKLLKWSGGVLSSWQNPSDHRISRFRYLVMLEFE